jgi:DNA-directed RNA polymerase subunit beta'
VKSGSPDGDHDWLPLQDRIVGRTALSDVVANGDVLVRAGHPIGPEDAAAIVAAGVHEVAVRSPVTCAGRGGICSRCFGWDPTTGSYPQVGTAIGVIAAQSMGEPAMQLTMRTFHVCLSGRTSAQGDGRREDIVGGLPRLDQLLEAWGRQQTASGEREELEALLAREGVAAAAEYLLVEMQKV